MNYPAVSFRANAPFIGQWQPAGYGRFATLPIGMPQPVAWSV